MNGNGDAAADRRAAHLQKAVDLAATGIAASLESVRLAHLSRLANRATREEC